MFDYFVQGLNLLVSIKTFLMMNLGMFIGIVFGVIPGLSANVAIVLLLPFTFILDPVNAMLMLLGIYCGGTYGGSISAILIGTPGTNTAAATLLDGYPMAQQGKAKKALLMALTASTIGGLLSAIILLFASPAIANFTLNFGPPEFFAIGVFGLSVIASISGDNLCKGLLGGAVGILLSMIGLDAMSGATRFNFGQIRLMSGLGMVPLLLGLFAITVVLDRIYTILDGKDSDKAVTMHSDDNLTLQDIKDSGPALTIGTFFGLVIGAIPGVGTGVAAFLSYNAAKQRSKHPEKFGTGIIEGIAAPEAANNAVTGTSLIPLLTLGIPGSAVAATLLGAMMMQGLIPGPNLFRTQGPMVYAIMIGFIVLNVIMYIQGRFLASAFAKIMTVPMKVLMPILVVTCIAGAFSFKNTLFFVYVLLAVGFVSYWLRKIDFPPVPILLGFILGPIVEFNLRRALVMSNGSFSIFFTRPISLVFIILTLFFIITLRRTGKKTDSATSK
jgi:putative tricarboxylic transport membrane protein